MKKIIPAILFLIVVVLLLTLHDKKTQTDNTSAGIKNKTPQRIVSLAPNLTEILFELGLGDKIVAVSNSSDYPKEALSKRKVGTFWQPDTESILTTKADLIFTLWFQQQKETANTLERLGHNVHSLKIENIDGLFQAIKKISELTKTQNKGKELTEKLNVRINKIKSLYGQVPKVRVLWVIQAEPLRVVGRKTFINQLLTWAGGENAIGETIYQYPPISTEELLKCQADIIIQSAMGTENIESQQKQASEFWSKYQNLPAVKNNRIYVINSDTILRLGPRITEGLDTIASLLHPESKD